MSMCGKIYAVAWAYTWKGKTNVGTNCVCVYNIMCVSWGHTFVSFCAFQYYVRYRILFKFDKHESTRCNHFPLFFFWYFNKRIDIWSRLSLNANNYNKEREIIENAFTHEWVLNIPSAWIYGRWNICSSFAKKKTMSKVWGSNKYPESIAIHGNGKTAAATTIIRSHIFISNLNLYNWINCPKRTHTQANLSSI